MGNDEPPVQAISLSDYRYPGELWSLIATFSVIMLVYALVILIFPSDLLSVVKALAITLAGVSVYVIIVIIQQRAALGTLVRVSPRQFPNIFILTNTAAERLSMRPVPVYVERSADMRSYPLGLWRKPMIVVTSSMVDQLDDESLRFFIARELSHICSGHVWLRVLLKPLGTDVAIVGKLLNNVIFGDWLNRSELTADRAGFIACQSLTASISAMLKFGVGVNLFSELDIEEFLAQISDVSNMSGRITEVVAGQPYLTQRVRELTQFALSETITRVTPEQHSQTQILKKLPGEFLKTKKTVDKTASKWMLVAVEGGEQYVLGVERTSIGRSPENDIVIVDDSVSRYHAEISRDGQHYYLGDMGSSNGVWLNSKRITKPSRLKDGDHITISKQVYLFTH